MRNSWATSIVLIVTAFSSAADAADGGKTDASSTVGTNIEFVALGRPSISLPQLNTGFREKTAFSWVPREKEKKWIYLIVHHSGTNRGSVEEIHADHGSRKDAAGNLWLGIGYHFVVGNGHGMSDGAIEPTFRWRQQIHGAHSGSAVHNANGIGICLIGNFEKNKPTPKQMIAVQRLVKQLAARYEIAPRLVIGHNTVKPTACPGRNFPLQDVRRNVISNSAD